MLFDVKAVTAAEFDTWLADKVAQANATPPPPAERRRRVARAMPSRSPPRTSPSTRPISTVKAGAPFRIDFDNQDAAVPHNVAIHLGSPTGTEVFKGAIFPGVATQTYDVQALDAGTYGFVCTVHPTMTGTLTVQ